MGDEKPEAPKASPVETFVPPADNDGEEINLPLHSEVYAGQNQIGNGGTDSAQAGDQPGGGQPAEIAVVTDRAQAGDAPGDDPIDPYDQIDATNSLARQLDALLLMGKKPEDMVSVRIGDKIQQVTLTRAVEQLKQAMVEELKKARDGADAIRQTGDGTNPGISDMARENTVNRDKLAKDLGLDPATITLDSLGQEFRKANGNKERQDKLKELASVMAERDALSRLHYAPLAVRLVEAELTARGFLDPTLKPGDEVPDKHIKSAYDILKELPQPGNEKDVAAFGRGSKEIKDAREIFATTEKAVSISQMEQQMQRGLKIVAEVEKAKQGGDQAEEHYKNAIKIADTLNVGFLANETYREDNMKADISQELADTIRMGSNARLKYAEHLVSKGRFHEAQGLLAQVKADSPELIYQKRGEQVGYREHDGGKTYEDLDRAVTLGVTVNPANFEQAQTLLFEKLGNDKIGTIEDGNKFLDRIKDGTLGSDADIFKHLRSDAGTSTECLKMMKLVREQYRRDITDANKVLDQEVQQIEARKKQFDDKQTLTKDEEVEKARLERQIASLNATKNERQAYLNRVEAVTDFTEGIVHLSQGGAKSAHGLFNSALEKDPSLDADLKAMKGNNSDLKTLSELSDMTANTLEAYWQRNYKKFAVAGAMAAGTLTGVGLIGLCGYVGAGVTTTAITATIGGGLAGGAVHWGIHRTVNEKAGWPEFRDGAKIGAISAALVTSPWAAQAYSAKAGADVAVSMSTVGHLASKIGVTRGTLAGGLGISYTFEAGNVILDNKPIGQAAIDGTREGVFNTLLLGISRTWGLPSAGNSAVKNAMFNRYTFGTGFGLAAAPEAVAVIVDGKPVDRAVKDTIHQGSMNWLMFSFMNKMAVQDPSKATGFSRFGLNPYSVGGGLGLAAIPEANNWLFHNKPGDQAFYDFLKQAPINVGAFALVGKYGMADYGTGARIAAPTFRDAAGYGARAFAMQESWNIAVSVGMKQIQHDLMKQPHYIKDQGQGFVAPLVADYFDRHYGSGLDPTHLGDRKEINRNLSELNTPLTSTLFVDKKPVDPRENGPKKGLFFDYSKPPPKPDDK